MLRRRNYCNVVLEKGFHVLTVCYFEFNLPSACLDRCAVYANETCKFYCGFFSLEVKSQERLALNFYPYVTVGNTTSLLGVEAEFFILPAQFPRDYLSCVRDDKTFKTLDNSSEETDLSHVTEKQKAQNV